MNKEFANIHFHEIRNNQFAKWFQEVKYNGETLSSDERKDFIAMIDETIKEYTQGLPLMQGVLEHFNDKNNELHQIYQKLASAMLFVLMTQTDIMVACKYFLMAEKDYERQFMRGKLMVILNEGFKRLYGFEEKTYKKSEWEKLLSLMKHFSEPINHQFQELTFLLQRHSESSSWWKDERNFETHIDAIKLYNSRQEEIIESKVVIDSTKLFCSLMAVSDFLGNLHTCLYNYLVDKYRKGELIIKG